MNDYYVVGNRGMVLDGHVIKSGEYLYHIKNDYKKKESHFKVCSNLMDIRNSNQVIIISNNSFKKLINCKTIISIKNIPPGVEAKFNVGDLVGHSLYGEPLGIVRKRYYNYIQNEWIYIPDMLSGDYDSIYFECSYNEYPESDLRAIDFIDSGIKIGDKTYKINYKRKED